MTPVIPNLPKASFGFDLVFFRRDVVHGRPFPTSALSLCTLDVRALGMELGTWDVPCQPIKKTLVV